MTITGLTKSWRQTLKRKGRRLWRPQRRWVRTRQNQKASQTNRSGLKPTEERDGGREVRVMSGKRGKQELLARCVWRRVRWSTREFYLYDYFTSLRTPHKCLSWILAQVFNYYWNSNSCADMRKPYFSTCFLPGPRACFLQEHAQGLLKRNELSNEHECAVLWAWVC